MENYSTSIADLYTDFSRMTDHFPAQQQVEILTYFSLTSGAAWILSLTAERRHQ